MVNRSIFKRAAAFLILLAFVTAQMLFFPTYNVHAATTSDGYVYTVSGTTATITDYTGSGGNIAIPATLDSFTVTSIGDNAFLYCSNLTSITVPNSVTSIGYRAFAACNSLTSVTIPNSVTSIGDHAFSESCITSITIPDSVTSIGNSALNGCKKLIEIYVDVNNTAYSSTEGILYDKLKTTLICYPAGKSDSSFILPNSVTCIGESAFLYCRSLTSVTIPNGITNISDGAFQDCSGLTNIAIPNGATRIGINAFYNCSSLMSVKIPNSVTRIANYAFANCSSLTSVAIPDSVTSFGDAFYNCTSLRNVTIPNGITSIDEKAFASCSSLTSVTIPSSVTSIGNYAFSGCSSLGSVTIPSSVTNIGNYAFSRCSSLTSMTIPDSVDSIGNSAFYYCSSMASVNLGKSITNIGNYAFAGCTSLKTINAYPLIAPKVNSETFYDVPPIAVLHRPTGASGYDVFPWAKFVDNLAYGKLPTSSYSVTNIYRLTNGDKNTNMYYGSTTGLQWVQLDLGTNYNLSDIKLWHYYADSRIYHDVIVQLSNDSTFATGVTTVFNNDTDNSSGLGAGADGEYKEASAGKDISFSSVNAKYIRLYSNGNTVNAYNHYVELEAYESEAAAAVHPASVILDKTKLELVPGETDTLTGTVLPAEASNKDFIWSSSAIGVATVSSNGVVTGVSEGIATITATTVDGGFTATCYVNVCNASNLACGKLLTSSYSVTNMYRLTDKDKNTNMYYGLTTGIQWVQLDLCSNYNVNEIKLWHYYGDKRSYHDVVVQLSNDPTFSTGVFTIFNNDTNNSAGLGAGTDKEYIETSSGLDIPFNVVDARYVRFYSNGSTANSYNHYVEIEVYGN